MYCNNLKFCANQHSVQVNRRTRHIQHLMDAVLQNIALVSNGGHLPLSDGIAKIPAAIMKVLQQENGEHPIAWDKIVSSDTLKKFVTTTSSSVNV